MTKFGILCSRKTGGSNASTSSWGATQPPQQQWDQAGGSNAAVNVNAANANVGQNATMWPSAAGTNPGSFTGGTHSYAFSEMFIHSHFHNQFPIRCARQCSGSQQAHEQIQSVSKAQGQTQQPQQAPTQQTQPQQAAGR